MPRTAKTTAARLSKAEAQVRAFEMFRRGLPVPAVARAVGRSDRAVRYWRAEARQALASVA